MPERFITGAVEIIRLSAISPSTPTTLKSREIKDIRFVTNDELTPDYLVETAKEHFAGRRVKEDSILLIIDEAQLLFNARDWTAKGRDRWTWFLQCTVILAI